MTKSKLSEPEEGVDFYIGEWCRHTVSIELTVDGLCRDREGNSEICREAIKLFRIGAIDSDAIKVYSEKIKDVALDCKTGLPFDRESWQISKCAELGVRMDGSPLRSWEKEQPKSQMEIELFLEGVSECERCYQSRKCETK